MMPFGIGTLELAAIFVVAIFVLCARPIHISWRVAFLGSVILATVITPADLFSMVVMAVVIMAVYFVGSRHGKAWPSLLRQE